MSFWLEHPALYVFVTGRHGEWNHSEWLRLLAALGRPDPKVIGLALEKIKNQYWEFIDRRTEFDAMDLARKITGKEPWWTILREESCPVCKGPLRHMDKSDREFVNLHVVLHVFCADPLCGCHSDPEVDYKPDYAGG